MIVAIHSDMKGIWFGRNYKVVKKKQTNNKLKDMAYKGEVLLVVTIYYDMKKDIVQPLL